MQGVAEQYAAKLSKQAESASQKRADAQYAAWKRQSEGGDGGEGFEEKLRRQQEGEREVAGRDGEATIRAVDAKRNRFYTDVRGKVPASFAANWGATRDGVEGGADGAGRDVEVPAGEVRVE